MTTSKNNTEPADVLPGAQHNGHSAKDSTSNSGTPLARVARLAISHPRGVLAITIAAFIGFLAIGVPGVGKLLPGGYQDPASESSKATRMLSEQFGQGDMDLYLLVTAADIRSDATRAAGMRLVDDLKSLPNVAAVRSPWTTTGPATAAMISDDGSSALIIAGVTGGEIHAQDNAERIAKQVAGTYDGLTVAAGGPAMIYAQLTSQTEIDLVTAEAIAIPLTFAVLVWVFGSLIAAALPLLVGAFSIAGTLFILRMYAEVTDVSIFALNLTTALGFALAIDYTLLIITRYREERAAAQSAEAALIRTMCTAGRTVIFSAVTVGLSMVALAFFPMFFLRSFAYAGTSVVFFAAVSAIVVAPALIVISGDHLDRADVRNSLRRLLRRPQPAEHAAQQQFWYRWARVVMDHRLEVGATGIAVLIILGIPFANVKLGFPDDRTLAPSLSSRQVGDSLRADFPGVRDTNMTVVLQGSGPMSRGALEDYASALSRVRGVEAVSSPTATFAQGAPIGPPTTFAAVAGTAAALSVTTHPVLHSPAADQLLDDLHDVSPPSGTSAFVTGLPQINRDSVGAIAHRLPLVLGFIAISSLVLLALVTGSLILPLQALLLNVLSLSATFGAVVWVFQDGHLGGLGSVATGTVIFNVPVLLFCVAFGLSMDYEVFVVSRMREYWLASDRTTTANREAVALGLASTGRVVTAAALVMSIVFAALISSKAAFMSMLGFGLSVAVLVDSTLVRATLVPALMGMTGRSNWWAPKFPPASLRRSRATN